MGSLHRKEYFTKYSERKAEFRDLCSKFINAFANFQKFCIGENNNGNNEDKEKYDDDDDKGYAFYSDFIYCLYCCAPKFGLLKSAVMTKPMNCRHNGVTTCMWSIHVLQKMKHWAA